MNPDHQAKEGCLRQSSSQARHPLNEEWLMAYAAGATSPGEELLISTYLKLVPDELQKVEEAARLGGELLASLDDISLAEDAWDKFCAQLDGSVPEQMKRGPGFPSVEQEFGIDSRTFIDRILNDDPHQDFWGFLGPGLRKAKLAQSSSGETLWLLKAKPGAHIPLHTHRGIELTLVLKGAYEDAQGRFYPGDVEEADDDIEHSLTIMDEGDCVCLALTQSPIVLRHWPARLLQRIVGF